MFLFSKNTQQFNQTSSVEGRHTVKHNCIMHLVIRVSAIRTIYYSEA